MIMKMYGSIGNLFSKWDNYRPLLGSDTHQLNWKYVRGRPNRKIVIPLIRICMVWTHTIGLPCYRP